MARSFLRSLAVDEEGPAIVLSRSGEPIRLSSERWRHIAREHEEMEGRLAEVLQAIGDPEELRIGRRGEILAIREVEPSKWLVAVYREGSDDGFVITAFLTRRRGWLERRRRLWP